MRRFLILSLMLAAFILTSCGPKVGEFIAAATTPFANPITATNIDQVKLGYAGAEALMLEYYDKCFGADGKKTVAEIKADAVLVVLCKRRISRWYAMKAADNRAYVLTRAADKFIANNPQGNAVSYISAAWKAVNDFKAQTSK